MLNTDLQLNWHKPQWHQIGQMLTQDRFTHAILMEGISGVGKKLFAYQLAQLLLCNSESKTGICQVCQSCQWFKAGTHPDFVVLQPEDGKKLISVEAVRQMSQHVFKTSHQNGYRILLIEPADAMTVAAANSLLKTLEEPPPQTLLLLVTDKPSRLLATIRSRALRLQFKLPHEDEALDWLRSQGLNSEDSQKIMSLSLGAPLRLDLTSEAVNSVIQDSHDWWQSVLALLGHETDPVKTAKIWAKSDPNLFLAWLDRLCRTLITYTMSSTTGSVDESILGEEVLYPGIEKFTGQFSTNRLFCLRDNVVELSQRQQSSLNWGLQLEALACDCQALVL